MVCLPAALSQDFNPRSPHGERPDGSGKQHSYQRFQSTLPAWGATAPGSPQRSHAMKFQSTLPAWGATCLACKDDQCAYFNPRSPHGERRRTYRYSFSSIEFQSTLPAWGATLLRSHVRRFDVDFNPRSPHGERPPGRPAP